MDRNSKNYLLGFACGLKHYVGKGSTRWMLKVEVERLHPKSDAVEVEAMVDMIVRSSKAKAFLPIKEGK